MIIKIKEPDRALIATGEMWVYFDSIVRVQTFGWVTAPDAKNDGDGVRISVTGAELRAWVTDHWGDEREFADELWPDLGPADSEAQASVRCVHALRDDGRMVLLLIEDEAYLLSDEGRTIDRL